MCRNGKEKIFRHVSAVAEVCKTLAETFGLDARKCVIGGMLHDISAVIAPADMLEYALKAEPTEYDMVLFIADKLAWDQEGIPPFLQ